MDRMIRVLIVVALATWVDAVGAAAARPEPGTSATAFAPQVPAISLVAADGRAPQKRKGGARVIAFAMIEGFLAANALVAAQEPQAYGIAAIAMAPLSLALERTDHRGILTSRQSALMFAAVGVYNLTLDDDELGKGEIFWRNLAAWHAVAATMWIGSRIVSPRREAGAIDPWRWSTEARFGGRGVAVGLRRRF